MKILLIIPTLGLGGAQRILVGLANRLNREGFDTTLLSFTSEDTRHFYQAEEGVSTQYLETIRGSTARHIRILSTPWRIRRVIKHTSPDVILSFQDIANFATLLATVGIDTPIIVSERQDIRFYRFPALRRLARRLLYGRAQQIVVQTDLIRQQFVAENLRHVSVIPNHVPATRSQPRPRISPNSRLTIVAAGRLEPQKDFQLIIDAVAAVPKLSEHCVIKIFGDGSLRTELDNRIRQQQLEQTITLEGASQSLHDELQKADLFLLSSRYEGFPNVLAEAVSTALPCIGYRSVSGVTELIENDRNGIVIDDDSRSPEVLGNTLYALIQDREKMWAMGGQSQQISSRFSEDHIFESWKDALSLS